MLQLMLGLRTLFEGAFDEVAAVAIASAANGQPRADYAHQQLCMHDVPFQCCTHINKQQMDSLCSV